MLIVFFFFFREDSGKTDSDLDDSWVMTVRGPNSLKTTPEFTSEWLSKKSHQNGLLHSKKSSQQKSKAEPSVSCKSRNNICIKSFVTNIELCLIHFYQIS